MRGLIRALRTSSKDLQNDDARSDLMWAGTLAGDKLFRLGKRCTCPCRRAALQLMEHTRHSRTDCLAVLQLAACRRVCIEQPAEPRGSPAGSGRPPDRPSRRWPKQGPKHCPPSCRNWGCPPVWRTSVWNRPPSPHSPLRVKTFGYIPHNESELPQWDYVPHNTDRTSDIRRHDTMTNRVLGADLTVSAVGLGVWASATPMGPPPSGARPSGPSGRLRSGLHHVRHR